MPCGNTTVPLWNMVHVWTAQWRLPWCHMWVFPHPNFPTGMTVLPNYSTVLPIPMSSPPAQAQLMSTMAVPTLHGYAPAVTSKYNIAMLMYDLHCMVMWFAQYAYVTCTVWSCDLLWMVMWLTLHAWSCDLHVWSCDFHYVVRWLSVYSCDMYSMVMWFALYGHVASLKLFIFERENNYYCCQC